MFAQFLVKILFDALFKTLNKPLLIGCRDWLFKADFSALKRPSQAEHADWNKETQIQKLTTNEVSKVKNFKVF